jgi:hypothetical protein
VVATATGTECSTGRIKTIVQGNSRIAGKHKGGGTWVTKLTGRERKGQEIKGGGIVTEKGTGRVSTGGEGKERVGDIDRKKLDGRSGEGQDNKGEMGLGLGRGAHSLSKNPFATKY